MGLSCCNCTRSLGPETKVQPTTITPADGKGAPETWCPKCFVGKRVHEETVEVADGSTRLRHQPHQTAVIRCRACGWECVSFGRARRGGGLHCNNCGADAGKILPVEELPINPRDTKDFVEAARAAGARVEKVGKASASP